MTSMILISYLHTSSLGKHEHGPDGDTREMVEGGLQVVTKTANIKKGKDAYGGKTYSWWFFTWNNPDHPNEKNKLLSQYEGSTTAYILFQYEKGEEGTKHYQGVLYNVKKITCSALSKKMVGCGYLAPVINTESAIKYCGKTESRIDGPWSAGRKPIQQGLRSDLLECKSIIDNGGGMDELFELQFSNAVRYGRGLKEYVTIKRRNIVRTWQTIAYIYTGDAGTGKTEAAKIESAAWGGGTYWLTIEKLGGKVWWDGYEGQENIIIDEFNCGLTLTDFKRLIDSSPMTVPFKGGSTQFLGKRVWFLSNNPVDAWYYKSAPPGPNRNALERRLHYKEWFGTRFQGQDNHEMYVETREWFVDLQKNGEWKINTN